MWQLLATKWVANAAQFVHENFDAIFVAVMLVLFFRLILIICEEM